MCRADYLIKKNSHSRGQSYQSGNVLVLFVISLSVLIIMASLALDGGHLLLNKGRLQNLVDASALHAAKEIDLGATKAEASAAALKLLKLNLAHTDQSELARAVDLDNTDDNSTAILTIEYSIFPDPFEVAGINEQAAYVKVSLRQLSLDNFLANIFSFNKRVSATAMAGPSSAVINCFTNLVPMMVCADEITNDDNDADYFGFNLGDLHVMKIGSTSNSPIGPGNFQLVKLNSNGKNAVRTALAGEENIAKTCFSTGSNNQSVPTEPGNAVGPVGQGINTRMGTWAGPVNDIEHPRDENICQGVNIKITAGGTLEVDALKKAYRASMYSEDNRTGTLSCTVPEAGLYVNNKQADIIPFTEGDLAPHPLPNRRIMNVVIGDCTGQSNGANHIDFLGVGCFFLTQSIQKKGGKESYVVGEFIKGCAGGGVPSLEPVDNPGPYKMVLYHVPGSMDS